jgi:hypothetical protein
MGMDVNSACLQCISRSHRLASGSGLAMSRVLPLLLLLLGDQGGEGQTPMCRAGKASLGDEVGVGESENT